jgi:hypothetical protein
LELAGDGYTEREIAAQLRISDTIHGDLTFLKQQANQRIQHFIDEQVPLEYQKTLAGLEGIIENMSSITFTPLRFNAWIEGCIIHLFR